MPLRAILSGGSKHNAATSLARLLARRADGIYSDLPQPDAGISLAGKSNALGDARQHKGPAGWSGPLKLRSRRWVRDQSATG
jgi:hypothetical protein